MQAAIAEGDAAIAAFTEAWGGEGAVVVAVDAPTALESRLHAAVGEARRRLEHFLAGKTRPDLEHVEAEVLETAPVEFRLSPSFRLVPIWNMSRRVLEHLMSFDCRPHLPLIAANGLSDCAPHQVLERFDGRVAEVAMIASLIRP